MARLESFKHTGAIDREHHSSARTAAQLIANAACPAVATDLDNRVVEWNPFFANLVGGDSLAGTNLQRLLDCRHPNGNPLSEGHVALHEMAFSGEAPAAFEIDVAPLGRDKVRVEVSITVVINGQEPGHRLLYFLRPRLRRRRIDAVLDDLLNSDRPRRGPRTSEGPPSKLTRRQLEVLRLMAIGATASEMADELGISTNTIRSHIRGIFDTLAVTRQTEAVAQALRDGII